MKFGTIDGLMHGQWTVVHDSGELGTAVTSYDITGLDGDVDEEYMLIIRIVNDYAGSSSVNMQINDDSSTYGQQRMSGNDSTASANRETSNSSISVSLTDAQNKLSLTKFNIKAKTGTSLTTDITTDTCRYFISGA